MAYCKSNTSTVYLWDHIRVLHCDTDFRWLVWEPVLYRSSTAPNTVDGLCHNWSPNPNPSTDQKPNIEPQNGFLAMFGVQMVGLPSDSNITKPLERKQRPGSHLSCSTFPATLVVQGSNGNHLLFLEVTLLLHPPKFNMEPIWQCVKTLYPWWTSK